MAKPVSGRGKNKTQSFYDSIAEVHNFALSLNGYRASVSKYLRSLDLGLTKESVILDAGSGTGIVTLGFQDAGFTPKKTIALDLSRKSLKVAAEQFTRKKHGNRIGLSPVQGNVLEMPFDDDTFDLVISCGVLEYVSLEEGLREMARVIKPGGNLVFIPVKPSFVGSMLEFLYKFKTHSIENVRRISQQHFKIVGNHEFPINEPISWSKTIFLLEKITNKT